MRAFANAGGVIYAECGGMIYLSHSVQSVDGLSADMGASMFEPRSMQVLERVLRQFAAVPVSGISEVPVAQWAFLISVPT